MGSSARKTNPRAAVAGCERELQNLLENGTYATIAEIAEAENINETYVGRILRLTLLAPHTIETIVSGRNPQSWHLALLVRPFPVVWNEQWDRFSGKLG